MVLDYPVTYRNGKVLCIVHTGRRAACNCCSHHCHTGIDRHQRTILNCRTCSAIVLHGPDNLLVGCVVGHHSCAQSQSLPHLSLIRYIGDICNRHKRRGAWFKFCCDSNRISRHKETVVCYGNYCGIVACFIDLERVRLYLIVVVRYQRHVDKLPLRRTALIGQNSAVGHCVSADYVGSLCHSDNRYGIYLLTSVLSRYGIVDGITKILGYAACGRDTGFFAYGNCRRERCDICAIRNRYLDLRARDPAGSIGNRKRENPFFCAFCNNENRQFFAGTAGIIGSRNCKGNCTSGGRRTADDAAYLIQRQASRQTARSDAPSDRSITGGRQCVGIGLVLFAVF